MVLGEISMSAYNSTSDVRGAWHPQLYQRIYERLVAENAEELIRGGPNLKEKLKALKRLANAAAEVWEEYFPQDDLTDQK
jgi:hypothetical protein